MSQQQARRSYPPTALAAYSDARLSSQSAVQAAQSAPPALWQVAADGDVSALRQVMDQQQQHSAAAQAAQAAAAPSVVNTLAHFEPLEEDVAPLHLAARGGHSTAVLSLVEEYDALVNLAASNGATPLHYAAQNGHDGTVRTLVLQCSAHVNMRTPYGHTALHWAAENGHADTVRTLVLQCGAVVNARDDDDWTPLHFAAYNGRDSVVQVLVEQCHADVHAKSIRARTPLDLARWRGKQDTAAQIIQLTAAQLSATLHQSPALNASGSPDVSASGQPAAAGSSPRNAPSAPLPNSVHELQELVHAKDAVIERQTRQISSLQQSLDQLVREMGSASPRGRPLPPAVPDGTSPSHPPHAPARA